MFKTLFFFDERSRPFFLYFCCLSGTQIAIRHIVGSEIINILLLLNQGFCDKYVNQNTKSKFKIC